MRNAPIEYFEKMRYSATTSTTNTNSVNHSGTNWVTIGTPKRGTPTASRSDPL